MERAPPPTGRFAAGSLPARLLDGLRRHGGSWLLGVVTAAVIGGPVRWHVVNQIRLFATRVAFPTDIDWMEGGNLYQGYRFARGLPIYIAPTRGWVPLSYPPLHFVVLAALDHTVGLDYASARGLSVACALITVACTSFEIVRSAASRWVGALVALVAIASIGAGSPFVAAQWDAVRPDTLTLAFAVVAAVLVPVADARLSWGRCVAIALCLTASVYAKQTSAFFGMAVIGYLLSRSLRDGLRVAALTGALGVAVLAALNLATAGWFLPWLLNMRHHALEMGNVWKYAQSMLAYAPFVVALPVLAVALRVTGALRPRTTLWLGMLVAAVPATLLPAAKVGGYDNDLIPFVALAWPVTGLLVIDLLRGPWASPAARRAVGVATLATAGALLELMVYDPSGLMPSRADHDTAEAVNALVRSLDGGVVCPSAPFLAARNGDSTTQPFVVSYVDAKLGGVPVDLGHDIGLAHPKWLLLLGTGVERDAAATLASRYTPVREDDARLFELAYATSWTVPRSLYRDGVWKMPHQVLFRRLDE